MKLQTLIACDGYNLSLALYEPKAPKGVILIMHGMEEHKGRYDWFAQILEKKGFIVCVSDMRGHGESAPVLGFFAKKHGDSIIVRDYTEIIKFLKEKYCDLPLYLIAHSMGSITARVLLQSQSFSFAKVVLSGYPNYNPASGIGLAIAKLLCLFKGPKGHSKFMDNLCTGAFNKKIKNAKTNLDWLSYDEENVQKYIKDRLSGVPFTVSGYRDLLTLMKKMHNKNLYRGINTCLPIYCISGEDDPCTGGEKGRNDSITTLRKEGFAAVQVKTYTKMRHEILNEKERDAVTNDIILFLES